MGYSSRTGRRPAEYASKSAHGFLVKDPSVREFLQHCNLPKESGEVSFDGHSRFKFTPPAENPIKHVIAIDGGYTEVVVQPKFPSATIAFFQFGALVFDTSDLEGVEHSAFIDPSDMEKLKRIQRIKLSLPIRNITIKGHMSLTASIRELLYDFFRRESEDGSLLETLRWLIFREFEGPVSEWTLANCPNCHKSSIPLVRSEMTPDGRFKCSYCAGNIYLSDVLRLHEAIDDELGAGGILGYVTTAVEQIILVHLIRVILSTKPSLLKEVVFIKDGPLGFFGQTANLHKPVRELVAFLIAKHDFYLAGFEKSGSFVEHAHEIEPLLSPGDVLLLDNDYIYRYIIPGKADPANPYGRTTYYGNKIIFKSRAEKLHVVTLPTKDVLAKPVRADFHNIDAMLLNIEKLKCDMYDDSLVPIALVNKLVSLADHPSSQILQKFAIKTMAAQP